MYQHSLKSFIAMAVLAAFALPAIAVPTAIIPNRGWFADIQENGSGPTAGSAFTFSIGAGETASFKVTDWYLVGDSFWLFSGSDKVAESSAQTTTALTPITGEDARGVSGWNDSSFEKFEYIVSDAGDYSFSIYGDILGTAMPAGLFVRLDVTDSRTVPEPASLALLGLGLAGLVATRRRKPV